MKSLKEKQRWGIRKFTNGVGSKLLGLIIVGMSLTAMSTTTFADEVTQPTTNDPTVVNKVEAPTTAEVQPTFVEATQSTEVIETPVVTEDVAAETQPVVTESDIDTTVANTNPVTETQQTDGGVNETNETPDEPVAVEETTNEEPVMAMAAVVADSEPKEVRPTSVELVTDPNGVKYIEIVLPDYEKYADGSTVTLTMNDYNHAGISKQLIRLGSSTVATVTTETGPNTFVNNVHEKYLQTGVADITTGDLETLIDNFVSSSETINLVVRLTDSINAVAINRKLRIGIDTSLDNVKYLALPDLLKVPLSDGAKWNSYLNALGAVSEGTLSYNGNVLDTQTVNYKLTGWPSSDGDKLKLADSYGPGIFAIPALPDQTPNANIVSQVNGVDGMIAFHLGGASAGFIDGEGTSEAHTYRPGELSFSMSIGDGSIYKLKEGLTNSTVTQSRVTTLPTTTSTYSNDGSVFRKQSTPVARENVEWDITVDYDTNTVTFSNKNVLDIEKEDGLRMFSVVSKSSIGNGFFDYFKLKDEFESMVDIATLTAPLDLTVTATDHVINKTVTKIDPTANVLLSNLAGGDAVGTILVENIDGDTGEIISTRTVTENTIWSDKYSDSPEPIINDYTYARMADDSAVKEGFVGSGTRTIKYVYYNLTPATIVEEIQPTTVYQADSSLPFQTQQEVDPGQPGSKTTTTTYEIVDGQKVVKTGEPVVVDAQPRVVNVGNRNETTETTLYATVYRENSEITAGDQVRVQDGQEGSVLHIDSYDVNPDTGELTGLTQSTIVTESVDEIIEVGTKPVVYKEPIPFETETVYDDTIFPEESYTRTEGVNGETTTTTTYVLNPLTGEVTPNATTETIDPITEVKVVGTKTQTTENTPIPYETIYVENPELPNGERNVVTPGEDGNTQTVTTNGVPVETVTKEPVTEVIEVGTKPVVEVITKDPTVTYVENPDLPNGEQNETDPGNGEVTTTTTTYTVDPKTGEVTPNTTTEVTPGTPKVIEVGTKPLVEKEPIPFETETVYDDTIFPEESYTRTEGVNGETTTTTTYVLNPLTGEVTPNITTETVDPITEVKVVGTKTQTTENTPIPYETTYVENPELPSGEQNVVTPGEEGNTQTVTTNGIPVETVTKEPVTEVIEVGTKPNVEVSTKDPSVTYVENPELPNGEQNETDPGNGEVTTTTTTYTVDPKTGEVTPDTTTEVTPGTPKVIEVGTKPVVEVVTKDPSVTYVENPELPNGEQNETDPGNGEVTTTTTTYTVDPNTGEVTPNTTTEVTPETPKVIEVGTKPTIDVSTKDPSVTYVENPELPTGEQNEINPGNGEVTTVTTIYTVDPNTGEVTPNTTTEVTPETPKVIEVGTKPTVEKEPIPFETEVIYDGTIFPEDSYTKVPGVDGETTITTTYTVDPNTGEVTPNATTEIKDPTTEVKVVGTKTVTVTEVPVPHKTVYVENPDTPVGTRTVTQQGEDGVKTITTTNGNPVEEITKEPTDTIIEVGTKPTVETNVDEPTVTYVENPDTPVGTRDETPGKGKTTTTTTTYTVDPDTGEVTPNVTTTTEDGTPTVVEVGTKPSVDKDVISHDTEVVYDDTLLPNESYVKTPGQNGEITNTTTYTVDPNTGEVTPNVTTETVDPITEIRVVGTKTVTVETEVTPHNTVYVENPELPAGDKVVKVQGQDGLKTITTTNGQSSVVITKTPVDTVIEVGTKPVVSTTTATPEITYVANPDLPVGNRNETPGRGDVTTTTTSYTIDKDGNLLPQTSTSVTPGTATVIEIGTKTTVSEEVIPHGEVVKEDPTLPVGETKVIPGKDSKTITTTTYTIDENGELVPHVNTIIEDGVDTIKLVGTKEAEKPSEDKAEVKETEKTVVEQPVAKNTVVESQKVIADTNTNQNVDNQNELPNTGEEPNNLGVIGAMMLGMFGFIGIKRRKKD